MSLPMPRDTPLFEGLMDQYLQQKQLGVVNKQKQQEYELERPLKEAQAAKANMMTNLIGHLTGMPSPGSQNQYGLNQPNQPASGNISSGGLGTLSPQQGQDLLATLMGFKPEHHYEGGVEYTYNPLTGVRERKIGETPQEKREAETNEAVNKKSKEQNLEEYVKGQQLKSSYKAARNAIENPQYLKMNTLHKKALGSGFPLSDITQMITSKDEKNAFGKANAAFGDVVIKTGKEFKGTYSGTVNGIINGIKPIVGEDPAISAGKLNALETLNNIAQKRRELINEYQKKGLSAFDAQKLSEESISIDEIQNEVDKAMQQGQEQYNARMASNNAIQISPIVAKAQAQQPVANQTNSSKYTEQQLMQFYNNALKNNVPKAEADALLAQLRGQNK